jgi:hypothetical protein
VLAAGCAFESAAVSRNRSDTLALLPVRLTSVELVVISDALTLPFESNTSVSEPTLCRSSDSQRLVDAGRVPRSPATGCWSPASAPACGRWRASTTSSRRPGVGDGVPGVAAVVVEVVVAAVVVVVVVVASGDGIGVGAAVSVVHSPARLHSWPTAHSWRPLVWQTSEIESKLSTRPPRGHAFLHSAERHCAVVTRRDVQYSYSLPDEQPPSKRHLGGSLAVKRSHARPFQPATLFRH